MMTGEVEEFEERETLLCWKVNGFSSLDDRLDIFYSSPFFQFCGQRWFLRLYPNGRKWNRSEGYIGLYLWLCRSDTPIEVRYSLGIRTAKGETEVWEIDTNTFDGYRSHGVSRIVKKSELLRRRDELLPQDVLTVILTLKVLEDGLSETGFKNASVQATVQSNVADVSVQTAVENSGRGEPSEKTGPDKIVEDIGKLWPNGDHTDVLLKVRGVEFKAHRTILAARTPVLGAMFRHETVEKATGEASIDDCEPEVFEQVLHYIYKGAPRELTAENASALFIIADKYLVNEVKALCVRCMRDSLCLDTFCDTLTLSLMHREDELLKTATDFLSKNMIAVMETVEWQRFMREHPAWANEILIRATQLTSTRYEKEKRHLAEQCML